MTSIARRREHDDSGEYSDASQDNEHNNSGNDGGQQESDYDSQGSDTERSEGDPENQETERRVDDDEDRSNPQYIPKRGTFYEHDDRTAASGEESTNTTSETASEKKEGIETPAERRRPPRKSEIINKWSHDKYNENEQMPKSRDELVAIYGYDIRNEDAPPHARRNRRYGRGPNKYTRTWEDEEAYKRQAAAQAPRKPPNPEDFPDLGANKYSNKKTRGPRPRSKSQPASNESLENGSSLRRNASIKSAKPKPVAKSQPNKTPAKNQPNQAKNAKEKLPALENLTITASVFNNSQGQAQRKVNATVAQQRPVPTDQPKQNNAQGPQQPSTGPSKPPAQQQSAQQHKHSQQHNQQQQQTGAEPRGGSKRYSSLRQRPLAETYSPQQQQGQGPQQPQQGQQPQPQGQQPPQQPPNQQQHRYHAEYAGGGHQGSPAPHVPHPQQIIHQQVHRAAPASQAAAPSPPHPPHPPHQPHQPLPQPPHTQQVRLGMLEQQQLVSHPHHSLHNIPQPHPIGQMPPPPAQGYAPPAMMPAQYMQVSQAGGVTYYNCEQQEQQPRAQRRPTAAIPIVRPAAPERPANSSEKDNIDRIVENMFVRKPWPATHGAEKEKSQSDNRSSQEPPSKESSQPNSLTSSSISTDSKPCDSIDKPEREEKEEKEQKVEEKQESISTDA